MLLRVVSPGRPQRLAVVAYDMACPRRARRVRQLLESVHHARQYSVFEVLLHDGELHGLLAELSAACDFAVDRLAVWWPRQALRLQWQARGCRAFGCGEAPTGVPGVSPAALGDAGNFVVCYDISDPDTLDAVAAAVAANGHMLQRSVYWLRLPLPRLNAVLATCAQRLGNNDRLWAYPLAGANLLWQIGVQGCGVLPIAAHRWFCERRTKS